MVRTVGIEPTLLAEQDFKSRASTNSTTPASIRGIWCPRSDSNGHSLQNSILSRASLPISLLTNSNSLHKQKMCKTLCKNRTLSQQLLGLRSGEFEIEKRIIPDETMQIRMAARGVPDMAVRIAPSLFAASSRPSTRLGSSCSGAAQL